MEFEREQRSKVDEEIVFESGQRSPLGEVSERAEILR